MLPTSVKRLAMAPWARALWARALAVILLFVTTPGSVELVQEVVSFATGIEHCADDGCGDGNGECCPRSCMHCPCCAHPNAAPSMAHLLPAAALARDQAFGGHPTARRASGYRAPPFRPPVS